MAPATLPPAMSVDAPVTLNEAAALHPRPTDFTRQIPLRTLTLPAFPEPLWKRILYWLFAFGIAAAYLAFLLHFFVPASPGVDDNGYLVGGKQLARTGSPGIHKPNPFQFHGLMWVMTSGDRPGEQLWVYPKYPIGLPLLNAIPLWVNWNLGKTWAIYLSPVCTALSLLMIFGLACEIAGPFMGLLAMLLLGVNYVTLVLADMPLSHAPDLLFVTAGFWMLLRWWRSGSPLIGALAGFLIGYATTIRYSEGLLLLPLSVPVLMSIRWRASIFRLWWWRPIAAFLIVGAFVAWRLAMANRFTPLLSTLTFVAVVAALFPWRDRRRKGLIFRAVAAGLLGVLIVQSKLPAHVSLHFHAIQTAADEVKRPLLNEIKALIVLAGASAFAFTYLYAPCVLRRALLPILFWLIPVLWLIGFNYIAMGGITGYDTTNESDAFTFDQMGKQWEYLVQQLYDFGGFVILPLAVLGLITMYRWRWPIALVLTLWLVPGTLLYCAYYWGNGLGGVGYLRFFASLLPVFVISAVWFLRHGGWTRFNESPGRRGAIAMPLAAGVIVAAATGFGLRNALPMMSREQIVDLNLKYSVDQILHRIHPGSVVFTQQRVAMDALDNWLQWAGDYELYHALFDKSQYKIFPKGDPDSPSPRDRRYFEYMKSVLDKMSDQQLLQTQQGYMREAITASPPRAVYAVLPTNWVAPFGAKFIIGSPFTWTKTDQWTEPAQPLPEVTPTPMMPRPRGAVNRATTTWTIYQITLKPTPPATTKQSAMSSSTPSTTHSANGK